MNGVANASMAVESARKVCTRFHQGYRDHRLYPAGHPTTQNTMRLVSEAVQSHLDTSGPLVLQVGENRLFFEGEEVYTYPESRDNLAFLMFRDGIRAVTLLPGLEPDELGVFLDCLARADQMQDTDHDLSTALWEHDLLHIRFEVVDPFLEGEGAADESLDELRDTVLQRLNELASADKAEAEARSLDDGEADPTQGGTGLTREEHKPLDQEDLALTEEEIARGEWLASHPADPLDEFVVVLLEIVGNPAELPGGEDALMHALSLVVGRYLGDLDQAGLDLVLGQLGLMETEGRVPRGTVEKVFGDAATAEHLTRMISTATSISAEAVEGVEGFLARVRGSIYPALLEALAASDDKVIRKTVLDLLRMEGGVPPEHLWPMMKDSRWYVVRNAVELASTSSDPALVPNLEPLVRHADPRVRREVARSLAISTDPKAFSLLLRAVDDEDSTVRTLAVRGVARRGGMAQFPAVHAHVSSRDFETRPPEEVEAFLVAYAALGGGRAVPDLNKLWRRRVFGTRPLPLRLAAVAALGAAGCEEAKRALTEAMECGEPQLQRTAARAISEGQSRTRDVGR